MNILERIFTEAPTTCEEVRISCRVYFKTPVVYILTGWLYYQSGVWQRIEAQAEQPEISQAQLDKVLAGRWSMDERPSRKNTMELIYSFKRATGEHYNFQLRSKTTEYTDRRVQGLTLQRYADAGY